MTTKITLEFDEMPQNIAEKLAFVIEGFVGGKFPMACLHGSRIEHESSASPKPSMVKQKLKPGHVVIGMGVTQSVGSDRYAGTITRTSPSQKTVFFTRDKYKRVDSNGAYSESQEYEYETTPVIRGNLDGDTNESMARWSEKRQRYVVSGTAQSISIGRHAHFDPHF